MLVGDEKTQGLYFKRNENEHMNMRDLIIVIIMNTLLVYLGNINK